MTDQVNVQEAKTHLSQLLARVERGEDVVIARAGRPIAKLTAIRAPASRQLGFFPGLSIPDSFFEPLPESELAIWEGK